MNYGLHPPKPAFAGGVPDATVPAAQDFVVRQTRTLDKARASLHAAQQRQKAYADTHRKDVAYSPGDLVLLNSKNIRFKTGARKLMPKWLGPYKVLRTVGPVAVALELPAGWKHHPVFHVSLVKRYDASQRYTPPTPSPVDYMESGEELWKIERILDHEKKRQGRKTTYKYLVKWDGFGSEQNSWEPESNLLTCDAQVEEYFRHIWRGAELETEIEAFRKRMALHRKE